MPSNGGSEDPFWVIAARLLFVEICMKLHKEGRGSNQALNDELMTADLKHVHKLVENTIADPITAPEAARMAEAVRAVFNANASAIRLMPRKGREFSIRDWVQGKRAPGSILFLSARYVDMSVSRTLLTSWMDTAINTLMTLERTDEVRMWFLVDEMGALHRMPALEKGLQTARNFGGAIILGVHAFNKIEETYGKNIAITLSSLARSKLVLATSDRETATYGSDIIGHHQYKEMEEGYSYGANNIRDAVTLTPRRQIEPLVLPDEINSLPSLDGYLKYPEGFPAARVTLTYVNYPQKAPAFTPRPDHDGPDWISDDTPRATKPDEPAEDGASRAAPLPAAAQLRAEGKLPTLVIVVGKDEPAKAPGTAETIVAEPEQGQLPGIIDPVPATGEIVDMETGEVLPEPASEPTETEVKSTDPQPENIEDQSLREAREAYVDPDHDHGPDLGFV